jgi:hypothetical protein
MRSAWSPTRSMSLDTVLLVSPNCLLALPTVFASDLTSMSGLLSEGLLSERGTGTPITLRWRVRERINSPPATPAAVAPTATAGPLALLATSRTVPTKPFFDPLLRLCALGRCWLRLRLWLVRLAVAALERFEPLLEREEPLRDERALAPDELALARDELALAPEELAFAREEPVLGLLLDAEPLDDLLLVCLLPEDFLLAATALPSPF